MKRVLYFTALLLTVTGLFSCSAANGLVQSSGRLLQSAGRSVGISR